MSSRTLATRSMKKAIHHRANLQSYTLRAASQSAVPSKSKSSSKQPASPREQAWLTKYLKEHPAAMSMFMGLSRLLGYGSPKQLAARRVMALYQQLCATRADEEMKFWQQECDLPPTFQSWFTITNLHVWLLVVRLRALPPPHGINHIQALVDVFFLDVEDRIRAILQPRTFEAANRNPPVSAFYPNRRRDDPPEVGVTEDQGKNAARKNAPESLITRQMKIFREQYTGLSMALDLGLVRGDTELAGAIWRNFLGARGARGIVYTEDYDGSTAQTVFRRSVNPTDSNIKKISDNLAALEAAETEDDLSGVHDYAPNEADKYLAYPELMKTLATYVRKELVRLGRLSDAQVLGTMKSGQEFEGLKLLKFGHVKEH
ncbi:hypothetical protein NEOLEDRAFT_1138481 [Neolentinus lepideus HHB14362 ss-1]|uniref:Ubiquinol-cytochrome c chaperone domain-containing protein n=1 Tax=Neolentinus lepideus HHB14362 ss-1 TaxID=1314782 RepID=A0A165QA83_9AGAM|nr:hypothetical protein NEOLEDRAFT_1138481 [Neolentinus lepideus HHB14362 ss-1]